MFKINYNRINLDKSRQEREVPTERENGSFAKYSFMCVCVCGNFSICVLQYTIATCALKNSSAERSLCNQIQSSCVGMQKRTRLHVAAQYSCLYSAGRVIFVFWFVAFNLNLLRVLHNALSVS